MVQDMMKSSGRLSCKGGSSARIAGMVIASAAFLLSASTARAQTSLLIDSIGDGSQPLSVASGIAAGPSGNVFVCGNFSGNAFKITPGGAVTQIIDATGDGVSPLLEPADIATDDSGNVFVAGFASDNVFRIEPDGAIQEIIDATGDGANPLDEPIALAVDGAGNLYVGSQKSDNVFRISPAGVITEILDASGDGVHGLADPTSIDIDAAGNVYVVGEGSENLFKITPGGVVSRIAAISGLRGVAVDAAGNAILAAGSTVRRLTPAGTLSTLMDGTGDGTNPLVFAGNVALGAAGDVLVAGSSTGSVFQIRADGSVRQVMDDSGDGENGLLVPRVVVDSSGNALVAGLLTSNAFVVRLEPLDCANGPVFGCFRYDRAKLKVSEQRDGKESLLAVMSSANLSQAGLPFNFPANGASDLRLCVFNEAGELAADLWLDRSRQTCSGKPCWKAPKGAARFIFKDPERAESGMSKVLLLNSAIDKKNKMVLKAGNNVPKGQDAMPTGIAAALQGSSSVTVQVASLGGDGSGGLGNEEYCHSATLNSVKDTTPDVIVAKKVD